MWEVVEDGTDEPGARQHGGPNVWRATASAEHPGSTTNTLYCQTGPFMFCGLPTAGPVPPQGKPPDTGGGRPADSDQVSSAPAVLILRAGDDRRYTRLEGGSHAPREPM